MKANRLVYAVWLLAAAALYFFENNTGTRAILAASILVPLISVFCAYRCSRRTVLSLDAPASGKKGVPRLVSALGETLPPAIMAALVVYCLKSVPFGTFGDGARQLIAAAAVVALHLWKQNTLLSIGVGTALYMLLIRI